VTGQRQGERESQQDLEDDKNQNNDRSDNSEGARRPTETKRTTGI
jgi:hypothetical protein